MRHRQMRGRLIMVRCRIRADWSAWQTRALNMRGSLNAKRESGLKKGAKAPESLPLCRERQLISAGATRMASGWHRPKAHGGHPAPPFPGGATRIWTRARSPAPPWPHSNHARRRCNAQGHDETHHVLQSGRSHPGHAVKPQACPPPPRHNRSAWHRCRRPHHGQAQLCRKAG